MENAVVLGGYDTRANQSIVSDPIDCYFLYSGSLFSFFFFFFFFSLPVSHARPASPICFPTPGDSRSDESCARVDHWI